MDTVDEWIAGLNAFVAAEMADYRQRTEEYLRSLGADHPGQAVDKIWESVGGYAHPQPGSRLLQYGKQGRLCVRLFAPWEEGRACPHEWCADVYLR